MTRSYCRDDKPFPVSGGALTWLRLASGEVLLGDAQRHFERLRLGGYVRWDLTGRIEVTEAGYALLRGDAPEARAGTAAPAGSDLTPAVQTDAAEGTAETLARSSRWSNVAHDLDSAAVPTPEQHQGVGRDGLQHSASDSRSSHTPVPLTKDCECYDGSECDDRPGCVRLKP